MSKEHAYAYEAGYRDGSIHYELEHCPACKNVADLQEALDENARLRSELESVGTAAYLYGRSDLNADNAKLRELVRAFDWCTENFDTPNKCDRCPLPQSDALEPECEVRMYELGIEVDA